MRRVKKGCAFALAAAVILVGLGILQTQAADRIETDRNCSLTVSVDIGSAAGQNDAYLEDFNQMEIPVSVYKVAEVDVTGQKFTPTDLFKELDFTDAGKDRATAAAEWQALAEQADEILKKEIQGGTEPEPAGSTIVKMDEGMTVAQGKIEGTEENPLMPGLYLVVPEETYNPDYTVQYAFAPYLTSLPSSEYALTGAGSDEWIYDTTIGLKPDAVPLYGKLNIVKNLPEYNATLGRTSFVFRVVGVNAHNVVKYEEVVSMDFKEPGSQTVTLDKIPAGLNVTVTEIYSGASYEVEGDGEEVALICSEEGVTLGGQTEASVSFTNHYGGGNRAGYGVNNRFESDGEGGWIWENPTKPKDAPANE